MIVRTINTSDLAVAETVGVIIVKEDLLIVTLDGRRVIDIVIELCVRKVQLS